MAHHRELFQETFVVDSEGTMRERQENEDTIAAVFTTSEMTRNCSTRRVAPIQDASSRPPRVNIGFLRLPKNPVFLVCRVGGPECLPTEAFEASTPKEQETLQSTQKPRF